MPREYQIKINVDASAAKQAIKEFDEQTRAVFDKLNKTSFKPEAFINGINISINKVMELAAKQDASAAKIVTANAKIEQAYQKTAQTAAAANAAIPGTFSVPERSPLSWPPPGRKGTMRLVLTTSTATCSPPLLNFTTAVP